VDEDKLDRWRRRLEHAASLLSGRLDDPPSLAELASAAAVSPFHFHRIWRALTRRPDLFYAFVGTGQVPSSSKEANLVAYGLALQWAESAQNTQALGDLKRIGPPPYKDGTGGWAVLYKWRNACEGPDRDLFLASTLYYALAQPGYTLRDFNYSQDSQIVSEKALFDQTTNLDHKRLEGNFNVPVFVIQGEHDCTTPAELAKKYLDSISAPRKDFVVISGEGHFAAFIKSDEFLKDLIARVRPLALKKVK
jgi:pimeloyl-ACP methyl ester carboxylesterase